MRFFFQLCIAICMLWSNGLSAQGAHALWTALPAEPSLPENVFRPLRPTVATYFTMQPADMYQTLKDAPKEFTNGQPLSIELPMPDGQMRVFNVEETFMMAPELAARFPQIKTYAGLAADGSGSQVRLGLGDKGFYAFVFDASNEIFSLRPIAEGMINTYMAYKVSDLPETPGTMAKAGCGVTDDEHFKLKDLSANESLHKHFDKPEGGAALVSLHKFRLAITSKGEYSVYHGGTKEKILAAIVEAMNFINGLTERDLNVRFELIPDMDRLFYYDPNTDPFTGTLVSDWMDQNQLVLPPIVGNANFDIGHIFSVFVTGSAIGIAGGRVCNNTNKARACSSGAPAVGEQFYLTAAHEMCHQMDGSHSWNACSEDFDVQRSGTTAFEPGSGSTIMGYPGACGTNNVKSTNDSYYHLVNMIEVRDFYTTGIGNTCDVVVNTTNNDPVVTVLTPQNINIPISTPFIIDGTATDADGDALTYCWEQYDLGPRVELGEAETSSPLFRSWPPVTTGTRQLPRNPITNSKSELLPSYGRAINFRLTARDNKPNGGGSAWAELRVNANAAAGPFKVTYPTFSTDTWTTGSYQIVTWDVANTDKAPINCKKVNIALSYNAGTSFTTVLATDVPNTGRCCIKVPNTISNIARVRVSAADHIFFNLSGANFKIVNPTQPGLSLCAPALIDLVCFPKNYTTTVSTAAVGGLATPITLSATGLPAGATATFSPNPVNPGESATMTLNFPANQTGTSFDLNIIGTSGATTGSTISKLTLITNNFAAVQLQTPLNGAASIGQSPVLNWGSSPDANTYEVQIGTNASFEGAGLVSTNTTTAASYQAAGLEKGKVYFWRVRPVNECGPGPWTTAYAFSTGAESCTKYTSTDVPKLITSAAAVTIESRITVLTSGNVSDANVKLIQGNHTGFKQLDVRLVAPDATEVVLFNNKCNDNTSSAYKMGFDDASVTAFSCSALNATVPSVFKPQANLSDLNGKNINGAWTLRVADNKTGAGGSLTAFELELCSAVTLNPPVIVENKVLPMQSGANSTVTAAFLKATDANNTATQLTFHVLNQLPNGELKRNGVVLKAGDTFTQADIDNGLVAYFDFGSSGLQSFNFAVTDGEGGVAGGTFVFQFPTSEKEPLLSLPFTVMPNPASESVLISFPEALDSEAQVQLLDASGRMVQTAQTAAGATNMSMNVSNLPNGMYILTIQDANAIGTKKIVVKH